MIFPSVSHQCRENTTLLLIYRYKTVRSLLLLFCLFFFSGMIEELQSKTPQVAHQRNLFSQTITSSNQLSKGIFLVANDKLQDPYFSETVIFLVLHGEKGSLGVIINHPSTVKLAKLWPKMKGLKKNQDTIFIGGPVAREGIVLLVQSTHQSDREVHVFQDIYWSSDRRVFERIINKKKPGERFRVYAGHAGWGPEQLRQEVLRGDWHILEADQEIIFTSSPLELWPQLLQKSTMQWTSLEAQKSIVDLLKNSNFF